MVNVQGDEPLVHPEALRALAATFEDPTIEMATLIRPLEEGERGNPNVVKAVVDLRSEALYFTRADVPFARQGAPATRWAHQGLYGYRRATLVRLASSAMERLRAVPVGVASSAHSAPTIASCEEIIRGAIDRALDELAQYADDCDPGPEPTGAEGAGDGAPSLPPAA